MGNGRLRMAPERIARKRPAWQSPARRNLTGNVAGPPGAALGGLIPPTGGGGYPTGGGRRPENAEDPSCDRRMRGTPVWQRIP